MSNIDRSVSIWIVFNYTFPHWLITLKIWMNNTFSLTLSIKLFCINRSLILTIIRTISIFSICIIIFIPYGIWDTRVTLVNYRDGDKHLWTFTNKEIHNTPRKRIDFYSRMWLALRIRTGQINPVKFVKLSFIFKKVITWPNVN